MILLTDVAISTWMQSAFLSPFGTPFFVFAARWLITGTFLLSFVAFLSEREPNHRHMWKEMGWSVTLAFVLALVLSYALQRTRPFLAFPDQIRLLIPIPSSAFSLPSAHAATIWAWAGAATRLETRAAPLWVVVATTVSLGRVVTGVHYLSDVLCGALVGLFCVAMVRYGHRVLRRTTATV